MNQETPPRDATLFHNRAREARCEVRKLLTGLSTASLGVFFLSLVNEKQGVIATNRFVAGASLLLMAFATIAGVVAWIADAKRNYWFARSIEATNDQVGTPLFNKRRSWQNLMRAADACQTTAFASGVIVAAILLLQQLPPAAKP